jgi:hypothetical protein
MCVQDQPNVLDASPLGLENGGNLMIDEIVLNNFRCFKHIEVPELKRVNLIVGKNSSGKGAFMESVFLSSGSLAPQTVFQMRQSFLLTSRHTAACGRTFSTISRKRKYPLK